MTRPWVWLQLLIGWLPIWALYVVMMAAAHGTSLLFAAAIAGRAVIIAALLGLLVMRFTTRLAWPHPLTAGFVATHLLAAIVYAVTWQTVAGAVEIALHGHPTEAFMVRLRFIPFIITGMWLYVMVAGVSYATRATERAARAEAAAARSQLAALRAQLNPHFLFNALHTVVQLIPREPRRASEAAEQLAGLLRSTIEEDRDLVSLAEERDFVERYLALERLRFGERLRVEVALPEGTAGATVPCFALLTLVENAVRHGAEPKLEPTTISVGGQVADGALRLTVRDDGVGSDIDRLTRGEGTGLRRLRERLAALYGDGARLDFAAPPDGGVTATLVVPQRPAD